jgi:hypothetical protein
LLKAQRVFKNAAWIDHFFVVHVLDHPIRQTIQRRTPNRIQNAYLP